MTADLKPGEAVRWRPDGHDDAGHALVDRYIDGTVTAQRPLCIKITGSRGFTERCSGGWRALAVGAVVHASISPGTIQRLNPVIAQAVEETIAKQVAYLATPIRVRSPYAPLPATPEPAFRLFEQAGELYVDTKAGPVKLTEPGEVRFAQPGAGESDYKIPPAGGWSLTPPSQPAGYRPARIDWAKLKKQKAADPAVPWVTPVVYEQPEGGRRDDGFDQHQVDAAKAALLAPEPPRYPRAR